MNPRRYFPLGKAYGEAFCNRIKEVNELAGNLQNGKHTFLVAPRRYGKSSLCERAIEKLNLPSSHIDLHVATSEKDIERAILKQVVVLIGKTIGSIDKAIQSIKHLFKELKPKLSVETAGFKLELEASQQASTPELIREALLVLENLLKAKQQQAILLIDEFQRVIEIAPDMGIEGGIRSAAQEMQYLSLLFSGSSRHLIESIFQDEGRPLYKLCRKIRLERIAEHHYCQHLNQAAAQLWHGELSDAVFGKIMQLTERHPYYVNYLCDMLWSNHASLPDIPTVERAWENMVEEERSDLLTEFYSLTENQKKLLIYLASGQNEHGIYSTHASKAMGIPSTSVPKALQILLKRDIVEEHFKSRYRVINPVYKTILAL